AYGKSTAIIGIRATGCLWITSLLPLHRSALEGRESGAESRLDEQDVGGSSPSPPTIYRRWSVAMAKGKKRKVPPSRPAGKHRTTQAAGASVAAAAVNTSVTQSIPQANSAAASPGQQELVGRHWLNNAADASAQANEVIRAQRRARSAAFSGPATPGFTSGP